MDEVKIPGKKEMSMEGRREQLQQTVSCVLGWCSRNPGGWDPTGGYPIRRRKFFADGCLRQLRLRQLRFPPGHDGDPAICVVDFGG